MKTVEISEELQSLLESAEASDQDTVVLTDHERPVAALVSLKNVDPESLALSTSAEFLKIIKAARDEIRVGESITLDELESRFESASDKHRRAPGRP